MTMQFIILSILFILSRPSPPKNIQLHIGDSVFQKCEVSASSL